MDSAGRLSAVGIGGLQPQNGHLYNLIGGRRRGREARLATRILAPLQLVSIGSAYHRLHIRMVSAGHLSAFDIGGL